MHAHASFALWKVSKSFTIHTEFVSLGQTVNQHFHHKVLERLRKRVASVKRFIKEKWMPHHDKAPSRTVLLNTEFSAN